MNCHHIRKKLASYQDGELSAEEREQVSAHLDACPSCSHLYAEMEKAWKSLEIIQDIQPSPIFYRNLSGKIHAASGKRRWHVSSLWQLFPTPAATFALLLIGLSLGVFLGNAVVTEGQRPAHHQTASAEAPARLDYFKAFAPVPPGSLGDRYLQLASAAGEHKK
jgi:anti-sigma factor RsiW